MSREAMAMALDVLENYAPQHGEPEDICEAINALRDALAEERRDSALESALKIAAELDRKCEERRERLRLAEAEKAEAVVKQDLTTEPVAWQERTYSEEDKAWSNWYHIDNESLLIRQRYPRSWVELRPLYTHPPAALPIDHPERTGALGALNALFAENELPMSDRNGVLYDTIKAALAAARGKP